LGHAIPALLLTREKVTIYIGSYGDPNKSLKLNFGLLEIFFRYNPIDWKLGLCVSSDTSISIDKQIIYTIAGPVASLLTGSVALYFMLNYDMHGFLFFLLMIFTGSALFDFVGNLIPDPRPVHLYDGTSVFNDGYTLKQLFHSKRFPKEYAQAATLYNTQKYAEAAVIFEKLLTNTNDESIQRLAINSWLQAKNYAKAKLLSDKFALTAKLDSDDFSNMGFCYSELGLVNEAIEFYDKSLALNPHNKYALNNKGYTFIVMKKFTEAIPFFNKALEIDPHFAYSYTNRGLAKIKTGLTEEGLGDINYSFELDKNNSYGYKNLGIYHFDKGEHEKALELFLKSRELDSSTHMIHELISETEAKIGLPSTKAI
jgi:Flp pilus assembly protein TadD